MNRVLVTGATGFVGANLTRRLLKEGYEVHVLLRESSNIWRLKDILNELNTHIIDLLETEELCELLPKLDLDYIFHLAVYGGRPNQYQERKIINANLYGTINLLNALKTVDYKCLINTGSSSEYGIKPAAMKESDLCNPINVYGISKLASTLYCNYVAEKENKNIGTLRLFSPYGSYGSKGRLIPDVIINLLKNKDVNLANPDAVRDFIYIEDVIDLYLKVIKYPYKLKGEIYNVGYGRQTSVRYISETVKEILKSNSLLNFGAISGRKSDTLMWESDISKVKMVFGWEPKTTVKSGLKKSILWYYNNINLYEGV